MFRVFSPSLTNAGPSVARPRFPVVDGREPVLELLRVMFVLVDRGIRLLHERNEPAVVVRDRLIDPRAHSGLCHLRNS